MASCYGPMLNVFPELLRDYEVFKMDPHVHGGYGKRYDIRKVRGYWSWFKDRKMEIEGDLRVTNHQARFFVKDDFLTGKCVVKQNDMMEFEGNMYRVILDANFSREGGFTRCLMQRMAGLTDQQVTNENVDEAVLSDY